MMPNLAVEGTNGRNALNLFPLQLLLARSLLRYRNNVAGDGIDLHLHDVAGPGTAMSRDQTSLPCSFSSSPSLTTPPERA